MPLVPERQHSTTFIYESAEDAESDKNFIGMGFFVGVPSERHGGHFYAYLITNEHVVCDLQTIFARIHLSESGRNKHPLLREPDDLAVVAIPSNRVMTDVDNDLAVAIVSFPDNSLVHYAPIDSLIPDFRLDTTGEMPWVGVGDEILMLSRIVREGIHYLKGNTQVARFGNVALIPKHEEPFFLTEMRSIAGHSGSPVWVVLPQSEYGGWNICGTKLRYKHFGMKLLGINRGHLRDYEQIVTFDGRGGPKPHSRWVAQTNMAISQVVPAWIIADFLNSERVKKCRDEADAAFAKKGADVAEDSIKCKAPTGIGAAPTI